MTFTPSRIRILPDSLVDVIAAGEVIERPASIVKELVENALDAGGREIRIFLADGGCRLVKVQDDGGGMDQENALLAIERHATSKIASLEDLKTIRTLGFRGEALPSIASVGRFLMETWDGEAPSGTRIIMDGGRLVSVDPCGRARGTTVSLERIFRRLPARRKFLRSRETEQAWCLTAVEDAAMANPGAAFYVTSDGRELLSMPPASSLRERSASLWGVEAAVKLLDISHAKEGIRLEGLVSPPDQTYTRRWRHRVMINGRPVRDPVLNRAISSALSGSWPAGRFPALILSIWVPDEILDVNVHPAKREVRIKSPGLLSSVLGEAIKGIRVSTAPRPGFSVPFPMPYSKDSCEAVVAAESTLPFGSGQGRPASNPERPLEKPPDTALEKPSGFPRILGQILGTYIILEGEGGLEILDQHAAHERIIFNHLLARRSGEAVPVQRLAVPLVFSLSPSEAANLLAAADVLNSFGFEIGEFGEGTIRLAAVPADLKESVVEDLIRSLSADPEFGGHAAEDVALAVSRWACRQSVMAGRVLSTGEIARLVLDLEKAESGFSCPHGRPTRITLDRGDLERLFDRR